MAKKATEKASKIVKEKLIASGGTAVIPLMRAGIVRTITITNDGEGFTCDTPKVTIEFEIFDFVCEFLNSKGGYAPKGNAHSGNLDEGTVANLIAYDYGKFGNLEVTYILSAVLAWAGIAENQRGYINLK